MSDGGFAIILRAATSLAGCIAVCGLCKGIFSSKIGGGYIMKNTCPYRLTKPLKSPVLHNLNSILQKQRNMLIFKQKFATFNWTLFVLFISLFIRYHNTREVATHRIRNTVTQAPLPRLRNIWCVVLRPASAAGCRATRTAGAKTLKAPRHPIRRRIVGKRSSRNGAWPWAEKQSPKPAGRSSDGCKTPIRIPLNTKRTGTASLHSAPFLFSRGSCGQWKRR